MDKHHIVQAIFPDIVYSIRQVSIYQLNKRFFISLKLDSDTNTDLITSK